MFQYSYTVVLYECQRAKWAFCRRGNMMKPKNRRRLIVKGPPNNMRLTLIRRVKYSGEESAPTNAPPFALIAVP